MGIANPVTRETHGSGTHYHMQLAKQLAGMLQTPLEVMYLILHQCFLCGAELSWKRALAVLLCLLVKFLMEQHSLLLTAYVSVSKKENVNVKCKNIFLEKWYLSFQFMNYW